MRFNKKEKRILSLVFAFFGILSICSGIYMNCNTKKEKINYDLKIDIKKDKDIKAKSNDLKLKDITIEINNPISLDIKDYIENIDELDKNIIKISKLDTSLVNINQPGIYKYTITYKKKKYIADIIVKEKELPSINFTLKNITLLTNEIIPTDPKYYINEEITDEICNNIKLDLSEVKNEEQGNYNYYIYYKSTKYQGNILIRNPGPTIVQPTKKEKEEENNEIIENNKEEEKEVQE